MAPSRTAALAAVALLVVLAAMPAVTSAQRSLECHTFWDGPSANNSILDCLTDPDHIKGQWRHYVFPAFSALLFLVILLTFPIVFLCVACCGGCKPTSKLSGDRSRCCIWMWIIYVLLWSGAVTVLVIFGAELLASSASSLIDDTLSGPVTFFNNTAEHIIDFTSNWTTGVREPLEGIDLDLSAFTEVNDDVTDFLGRMEERKNKYIDWVPIVSYSVGGVAVVLMLLILPFALCRCCIPYVPLFLSCAYWIFGAVFALLGVACILLAFVSTAGCGEIELQYQRQPGVFQWYFVPYCEEMFDFRAINQQVAEAESENSMEACKALLAACDNKPGISLKPLQCGGGITEASQCPDFGTVADVLGSTLVKSFTMACPTPGKSCSLTECAASCKVELVKNIATEIMNVAAQARNASIAVAYAKPLLECNFVIDELLGAVSACNDLKTGTWMLGVGFFVGGLMFGLAIYIMFRGSCIWGYYFRKEQNITEEEMEGGEKLSNSGS